MCWWAIPQGYQSARSRYLGERPDCRHWPPSCAVSKYRVSGMCKTARCLRAGGGRARRIVVGDRAAARFWPSKSRYNSLADREGATDAPPVRHVTEQTRTSGRARRLNMPSIFLLAAIDEYETLKNGLQDALAIHMHHRISHAFSTHLEALQC